MTSPNFRYTTRVYSYTATVAANSSESDIIDMIGVPLIGIECPAGLKSNIICINMSTDGVTTKKMYNPYGVRMCVASQPGSYITIAPDDFRGVRYISLEVDKIESVSRTFTVYGRVDS